eukprot:TRINITY_DN2187_c0_g2_i3.p1 TRINITY_DN2187_c0_g2~~TRINITY_DN2187_c0_g2_i3.p1  ORF type:complete len:113 (+),score=1.40 TRINITY_DN2187_c0_g2_i3:7-345(+)
MTNEWQLVASPRLDFAGLEVSTRVGGVFVPECVFSKMLKISVNSNPFGRVPLAPRVPGGKISGLWKIFESHPGPSSYTSGNIYPQFIWHTQQSEGLVVKDTLKFRIQLAKST